MAVQPNEPPKIMNKYHFFEGDLVVNLMPKLTGEGYLLASAADIIDGRQNAVQGKPTFNMNFWTGDSVCTDEKGGRLLTLDSLLLRQVTPQSPLVDGALKFEEEQWEELKSDKEHSL